MRGCPVLTNERTRHVAFKRMERNSSFQKNKGGDFAVLKGRKMAFLIPQNDKKGIPHLQENRKITTSTQESEKGNSQFSRE